MGNLTNDQLALIRNKDAYGALTHLRKLKAQRIVVRADINARKVPITRDILKSEYDTLNMFQIMALLDISRVDWRAIGDGLEILKDINQKQPALEAYLTNVLSELTNQDYINEINNELSIE